MVSNGKSRPRVKPESAQPEPQPAARDRGRPTDLVLDSVVSEPLRAVIRSQPTGLIGVIIELRSPEGPASARRALAAMVKAGHRRAGAGTHWR